MSIDIILITCRKVERTRIDMKNLLNNYLLKVIDVEFGVYNTHIHSYKYIVIKYAYIETYTSIRTSSGKVKV